MVSEAEIAEARRKALRNGEEDPITVAQRYLNVYRQMHIFSQERKEEFDKSILNLSPIIITVISSLPGGLTFQDYIDEVLTKAGREKSAKSDDDTDNLSSLQPQILSNAQASIQPQQVVAPIMSGEAKLSMGKEFADEFAKIMTGIIAKQTTMQKESLAKVAQDLGKTQLFIAKKLEDNKAERQAEMNELCKTIAQSHTALSTSLATISEGLANQKQGNNLVAIPSVERSAEDDVRLAEMITQSQERIMSGLLSRLPQAVGVGIVNVTAASRSPEDDVRLAEMIAQSQEKILSKLIERLPQVTNSVQTEPVSTTSEIIPIKRSENVEEMMTLIAKSQERLIETLIERLPQMSTSVAPATIVSSSRSLEDDERLVEMISKSQEKLISSLIDKIPYSDGKEKIFPEVVKRTEEDDERLIRLITTSQESMIKSLIEKNVFMAQPYPPSMPPVYNQYQQAQVVQDSNQYYQNIPAETIDNQYYQQENPVNDFSNVQTDNNYQACIPAQNIENNNVSEIDFNMFTPEEEVNNISSILYDEESQNVGGQIYEQESAPDSNQNYEEFEEGTVSEIKKKKKKKKKKKSNDGEIFVNAEESSEDDGLSFLDSIPEESDVLNFNDIGDEANSDPANDGVETNVEYEEPEECLATKDNSIDDIEKSTFEENIEDTSVKTKQANDDIVYENAGSNDELQNKKEENSRDNDSDNSTDLEKLFDNKRLNSDDEDIEIKTEKRRENESSTKADFGIDLEDDSWGFDNTEEYDSPQSEEGWEYVEDDGNGYSEEEGWEYVEDDGSGYSEEEGWEYVEDNDNQFSNDDNWEYVEAIDDNSKIYSTDSFGQKTVYMKTMPNKTSKIHLTNIPQICDEANDDEIDDPYKNSILKD